MIDAALDSLVLAVTVSASPPDTLPIPALAASPDLRIVSWLVVGVLAIVAGGLYAACRINSPPKWHGWKWDGD